ncbi:sigma-54-dependent transcriptional regulator [Desulforhopalus singaporensis]|uniref:Two-component system, NtrC family, response regulator AtoC n=1 Tax=Desulforhopalus singaporensis TaxID=91360 RepID=A0A1H0THM3_9BACT|nr:sigma-54 dependent transcriptional regulator [Desulforhopalus singaporensis]SDP53331.1 two-component system, NtrC family, response regulator AtoC [Desulforhopalus singaporensis]
MKILLAEDDEIMRISIYDRLGKQGWRVDEAENGLAALELYQKNHYHLIVSDIRMPGLDGLSLLRNVQKNSPETDVIIMTAYGSVDDAIECLRIGAADYILKPFDMDDLIIRISRLLEAQQVKNRCEALEANCLASHDRKLIGSSKAMQKVHSLISQAAPTSATILITGESGTGKELAARAIHNASNRSDKPFVSINCAAIPEGLMESELFGHERGAFTGAEHRRKGKFELADTGTLLLDELGDLPAPLQAKLLRVLQENEFERVGGSKTVNVDVRIIACTSKDLQQEVQKGNFRQDLLYRLQVIPLEMPPLRTHKEDIGELCAFFLHEFNVLHGRSATLSEEALTRLKQYDFPGNARELRNIMERASVLTRGSTIEDNDLPLSTIDEAPDSNEDYNLGSHVAKTEERCIKKALQKSGGNRTAAAALLGISRKNLWEKIKIYNLS